MPPPVLPDWQRGRLLGAAREFANILPIYTPKNRAFCRAAFDMEFGAVMPSLMIDLFRVAQGHPDTLSYITWIRDACNYILDQGAPPPHTEPFDEDQEYRDRFE